MVHRSRPLSGRPHCQRDAYQRVTRDECFQEHVQRSLGELALRHSSTVSLGERRRALVHPPRRIITWLPHAALASEDRPNRVSNRLIRALWPRARAGCAVWCSVRPLDVLVQMRAEEEPAQWCARAQITASSSTSTARAGPPPTAFTAACVLSWRDRRGFTATPRGRHKRHGGPPRSPGLLLLCVQQWRS